MLTEKYIEAPDSRYRREYRIIRNSFDDKIYAKLVNNKAVLAGGAIRAIFAGEKISDYDLYFRSHLDCSIFGDFIMEQGGTSLCMSDNADTFKLSDKTIQIIKKITGEAQELLPRFDMTVTMGAFDFQTSTWLFHPNFFSDLAGRRIVFNNNLEYPFATVLRAFKYQTKGYHIASSELIKLVLKCHSIKVETIYEWKEQLLGIDTVILTEVFKQLEKEKDPAIVVDAAFVWDYIERYLRYKQDLFENQP